jgi:tetratricopeptide (TPR) repeat protein
MHRIASPVIGCLAVGCLAFAAAMLLPLPSQAQAQTLELNTIDLTKPTQGEVGPRKKEPAEEESVERAAKLRSVLLNRASIHEQLEDFERAEADFDALVAVRPQNPLVYSDRGYFYMRQRRYPDAMHDFMAGSRLAPTEAIFNYGAARAFLRMGDYEKAIAQYSEAIRLAPDDGIAALSRAEAYLQLGRYAQAVADYDRAITLGMPSSIDRFSAYFGRGYASIRAGDFVTAIRDMNAALGVRPGIVGAVVWRGYARERLGERSGALDDYEAALRLSPNDDWIRSSVRRMRS